MALRLDPIRLFIADDVGVGKTIEALLIAREMLDRGEIKRVCILTPPSLCDQCRRSILRQEHARKLLIYLQLHVGRFVNDFSALISPS